MAILANAGRALIDERKLRDYVLNPDHPVGGHKARVILAATGLGRGDHRAVADQVRSGISVNDAERVEPVPYGERFRVTVALAGPGGRLRVRTGWIYRSGEDVPRLATLYPILAD